MATHALERHVALVGFMGAGKTTLGRALAERIGRPFLDLDEELAERHGASAADLLRAQGEPAFRALEEEAAVDVLATRAPAVVALGGGALGSARTREALSSTALTLHVEVDPVEAWRRVGATADRPLASDRGRFLALHDERAPAYHAAGDLTVVSGDVDGAVLAAAGIHVETGALSRLDELVPGRGPVALVTDRRVAGIHGADAQLALGGRLATAHELPSGEEAKSLAVVETLLSELSLPRDGVLVALGGGSLTDAAGFAAASYLRGVAWVPVATTLLGQVDAAVGGKTGIDLRAGKNLVGAFHWPARTVLDPATLATLPEAEWRNGLAEVVKTGLLAGQPLWKLETEAQVRACAAYKAAVCLRDPREAGPRAVLNLGHTFAHALEAAAEFRLPHGRAVALGLRAALRLSGVDDAPVEDVLGPEPVRVDRERSWAALRRDKKVADGRIRLVLLDAPGRPRVVDDVPEVDVRRALDELIAD